jgi:hypothetical protein
MLCDLCAVVFIFAALVKSIRFHRAEELRNRPVWAYRKLARFQLLFMAGHAMVMTGSMLLLASTEPVVARLFDGAVACLMLWAFFFANHVRQYYLAQAQRVEDIHVRYSGSGVALAEYWANHGR